MIGAQQLLGVTGEAGLRKLATSAARKLGLAVTDSPVPLVAYVNHGRWIADCQCGGAVACDPDLGIAACFSHRDPDDPAMATSVVVHTRVTWPVNRRQIEALLRKRGVNRQRNWLPHETEADLRRENAAHGVKE